MENEGMQPIDWYVYAKDALSHYKGNGFAAFDILKDVQNKFLMDIPSQDRIAWFRDLHETIATTPTSWAARRWNGPLKPLWKTDRRTSSPTPSPR